MFQYTAIGIDPGLVHTGVVAVKIDPDTRRTTIDYEVILGDDVRAIQVAVAEMMRTPHPDGDVKVTIEKYRERGTVYGTHSDMRKLEAALNKAIPGSVLLDNMGVKKIVKRETLEVFNAWALPTTNHRDLQAAARIGLLGALKDPEWNEEFAQVVADHLDGKPWLAV